MRLERPRATRQTVFGFKASLPGGEPARRQASITTSVSNALQSNLSQ
jgi:hypothetical protein